MELDSSSLSSVSENEPCNERYRPVNIDEIEKHAAAGCTLCKVVHKGLSRFLGGDMKPDLHEIILESEESSSLVVRVLLKDPEKYTTHNFEFFSSKGPKLQPLSGACANNLQVSNFRGIL